MKAKYICLSCGKQEPKWIGQCYSCGDWNSLEAKEKLKTNSNLLMSDEISSINNVLITHKTRIKTQLIDFDNALGGGITEGSINLLTGSPGVGKSTLVMNICGNLCQLYAKDSVLYVSGEETKSQVAQRAQRLGIKNENFLIYHQSIWEKIKSAILLKKPKVFILDSIQTTSFDDSNRSIASSAQVKEICFEIMKFCKEQHVTTIVIGHITKDGSVAGPKILEHMVDCVISFEKEEKTETRILRVKKNRFGPTDEVGLFKMSKNGFREDSAHRYQLIHRVKKNNIGHVLSCLSEGSRLFFQECQSLVIENKNGFGKRVVKGIDQTRFLILIAIIEKYINISLQYHDIYLSVDGLQKDKNNDLDLAVVASLLSSVYLKVIPADYLFKGEISLSGSLNSIEVSRKHQKELISLGFKKIITGKNTSSRKEEDLDSISKIETLKKLIQTLN